MSFALVVEKLSKSYNSVVAVDQVSFKVPQGKCFGLLGPNGAGKTTTLEIIEGILKPDSGSIHYPLLKDKVALQQHIGIQFQNTALQDHITVKETLDLFSHLYNRTQPLESIIELCSLREFLDRDTKKLSGGQRQRLLLALALLHNPEIIFLDEPTTGLDPQSRRNFWELVVDIKKSGKTLILTTHYMDEAQFLCDEIVVMDQGRIITEGEPKVLLDEHFSGVMLALPKRNMREESWPLEVPEITGDIIKINSTELDTDLKKLMNAGISLTGLSIHQPNLEDLFIKLTGHNLRD